MGLGQLRVVGMALGLTALVSLTAYFALVLGTVSVEVLGKFKQLKVQEIEQEDLRRTISGCAARNGELAHIISTAARRIEHTQELVWAKHKDMDQCDTELQAAEATLEDLQQTVHGLKAQLGQQRTERAKLVQALGRRSGRAAASYAREPHEDLRNALIVELSAASQHTVQQLQGMDTHELLGMIPW